MRLGWAWPRGFNGLTLASALAASSACSGNIGDDGSLSQDNTTPDGVGGSAGVGGSGGNDFGPEPADPPFSVAAPEAAARLAAFLWQSETPQTSAQEILNAGSWGLVPQWSEAEAGAAIRWMIDRPATRSTIHRFYESWLATPYLATLEKNGLDELFDDTLRASFQKEGPAVGVHETLDASGSFSSLLLAPYTFVDGRLAEHYDFSGVEGPGLARREFAEPHRLGILAGAGVMTTFSSIGLLSWPAKRSWVVLESLLCFTIPSGVAFDIAPPDGSRSIKTQMVEVTADDNCMNCHTYLNSVGFALIGFDSLGRWDPTESFVAEETRGWVPAAVLSDQPEFSDWPDLMQQMAERPEAQRCFAQHWLSFAAGNREPLFRLGAPVAQPVLERVTRAFSEENLSLRELIVAVGLEVARGGDLVTPE